MRRTHMRGHDKIHKRLIVHAAGFNLSYYAFPRDTLLRILSQALLSLWPSDLDVLIRLARKPKWQVGADKSQVGEQNIPQPEPHK